MHPTIDAVATLGGRFNLIFSPHDACVFHNAYGRFRERPLDMTLGIKTPEGHVWALPFTSGADRFPFVEQFSTLTSIAYRGVHPSLGIEMTARIRAPFYPRNAGISTAPFYYVDVEVRAIEHFRWERAETPLRRGRIVFELGGDNVAFDRTEHGFRYGFDSATGIRRGATEASAPVHSWVESTDAEPLGPAGLTREFDLDGQGPARLSMIWSAWAAEPVLDISGELTPFKYSRIFDSREEMVAWAGEERSRIEERCDVLDRAVQDWSLGCGASDLAALALHTFLANTWWTVRKDGRDWFSVWEGSCYFHSTIDVEYNDAMLYFALWPELLEMLLDQWAEFEMDGVEALGPAGKGTGYLSHDMGINCSVGQQAYPHAMHVEENANYLLLLCALVGFTGNLKQAARMPLYRRLAGFIAKADTTGNGVPDTGVANTIDDASPAVQFGREQTYLAVKAQAALWALADLEQRLGAKAPQAERWRAVVAKSIKSVEEGAWLGDHYAVTLARTTEGLTDPWTGEALPPGELAGWDDYSIYAANGLLYLFLAGVKMPRWRVNRFAADAENACRATMGPHGCRHSSSADSIAWFSQNMWRDYVAAYLGVDILANVERYQRYQVATGDDYRPALYCDTTEGNNLSFYPRGATVFGMPMAAVGLRLNRLDGELALSPLRTTMSVPLLPLADWEQMRIPVLTVRNREGVATARISERDLLDGLAVRVSGAELDPD